MIEVIRWVANYLMVGVIVQFMIQGLASLLKSPKLDVKESVITIVVWPMALAMFTWFFIKGILTNRER